jgi:CBS domain containing-hemolysin-like protein
LGVVTLEDILEEVLGDLYDEDDDQAVIQLLAARGKVSGMPTPALQRKGSRLSTT